MCTNYFLRRNLCLKFLKGRYYKTLVFMLYYNLTAWVRGPVLGERKKLLKIAYHDTGQFNQTEKYFRFSMPKTELSTMARRCHTTRVYRYMFLRFLIKIFSRNPSSDTQPADAFLMIIIAFVTFSCS